MKVHEPAKRIRELTLYQDRKSQPNFKLDIEPYDEATDIADVDNFEYNDRDISYKLDIPHKRNDDLLYGEDKIVGGFEVDINLYPYHVAYGSNCGGAIIDRKWVITAGHCGWVNILGLVINIFAYLGGLALNVGLIPTRGR